MNKPVFFIAVVIAIASFIGTLYISKESLYALLLTDVMLIAFGVIAHQLFSKTFGNNSNDDKEL